MPTKQEWHAIVVVVVEVVVICKYNSDSYCKNNCSSNCKSNYWVKIKSIKKDTQKRQTNVNSNQT